MVKAGRANGVNRQRSDQWRCEGAAVGADHRGGDRRRTPGRRPGRRVIAGLVGQAQTDPDLSAALLERYSGPRRELAVAAMRRAQHRGQLHAGIDPQVLVDQLWGACYHRLLLPDEPLTEDFATQLVDNLLHGVGGQARDGAAAP